MPGARKEIEVDEPVDTPVFVMFSLLAVLALMAAAIIFGIQSIEKDLETTATARLQEAGLNRTRVQVTGNDIQVLGDVPDRSMLSIIALEVETITGVGEVKVDVRVIEPGGESTLEITGRTLLIEWDASNVTVEGDVSDSATRQTILATVTREFRGEVNSDELGLIDALESESAWLANVVSVIGDAGRLISEGQITVNPNGVMVVAGELKTRQERSDLLASIEERLAAVDFEFISGLTLAEAPPLPPRQQVIELQENLDDLIEGKVVEFEVGLDVITVDGQTLLNEIFDAIQRFPDVPIEIAGHADSQGSADANLDLSVRRAQAVLAYLIEKGSLPGRFVVNGYGETRPVADNSTEEGRQRNRRIEFIALEE
jgi:OOP family OmpA-OmpF porin